MVKVLIESRTDLHEISETHLHYAVEEKPDFRIISYLIEKTGIAHLDDDSIDLIIKEYYENVVKDTQLFRELLNGSDRAKVVFLFKSISEEDTESLKEILQSGVDINQKQNSNSALNRAIHERNFDMVKILVEAGADLHATNAKDEPNLYYAAYGKLGFKIILYLIEKIGISHIDSDTIDLILDQYYKKVVKDTPLFHGLLRNDYAKLALLFKSIRKEDLETFKEVLQSGVDVNQQKKSKSALNRAIHKDNFAMVEMLVEAGADLNATDLQYAEDRQSEAKIISYLIEKVKASHNGNDISNSQTNTTDAISIDDFIQRAIDKTLEGEPLIETRSLGRLRYQGEAFSNKKIAAYKAVSDDLNREYIIKVSLKKSKDLSKERQRVADYKQYDLPHADYFEGDARYSIREFIAGIRGDEFITQWEEEGGDLNDPKIRKLFDLTDKMMGDVVYFGNLSPKNMVWNDGIQDWVIVDSSSAQEVTTQREVRKKVIRSFRSKWFRSPPMSSTSSQACIELLKKKDSAP